jgi:hypothetical protein
MRTPRSRRTLLSTTLFLGVVACGSDPILPTVADIAGSYEATLFVGGGFDVLAEGGSLTLTFGENGSVSGTLFIPGSAGGPLTADMAGTFTVSGGNISISQSADTFVRDATWTWNNGVIDGAWSGGGVTATVRLERA